MKYCYDPGSSEVDTIVFTGLIVRREKQRSLTFLLEDNAASTAASTVT
jgi:hypothetical protein